MPNLRPEGEGLEARQERYCPDARREGLIAGAVDQEGLGAWVSITPHSLYLSGNSLALTLSSSCSSPQLSSFRHLQKPWCLFLFGKRNKWVKECCRRRSGPSMKLKAPFLNFQSLCLGTSGGLLQLENQRFQYTCTLYKVAVFVCNFQLKNYSYFLLIIFFV